MHLFALSPARKLLLASAAAAFLSFAVLPAQAQPDPPAQAGRVSYISGSVSIQPAGVDDWSQAVPNLPLGPGDRIFTDFDGRAEIQVGQTFVRIGPNSDVSLVDSTDLGLYFGVAQGSIHLRTNGLWPDQSVFVNTPSGSSTLSTPGELRVDVMPGQDAALFTSFGANVFLSGAGGFQQWIGGGQALELAGSNPVYPQWLQPADWDNLDYWSHQRDQQIAQAVSYRYVSQEIPGAYELDANGTWMPDSPYGPIWFPNNVPYGWAPYHYGHWVNHAPWGWVWVEDEPWGYAPFHYGRWVSFNGRWGWVAGPPAAHPVWSPALVVFAGGIHVGGVSVSAWFPLGPGEAYHPWYPCSPRYVDRVNITNIVEAPRVHVQNTYVNINVVNITYVNRTTVTAVRNEDFAAGRPSHQAAVNVDVHVMDHVQVMDRPAPQPTRQSFAGPPPVRPVAVSAARPVLINEKGMAIAARPGAQSAPPPVKAASPVVRPLPGHTVVAPPPNAGKSLPPPAAKPAPVPPAKPEMNPAPPAPAKPAPQPVLKPVPPPAARPVVSAPAPVAPKPVEKPVPEPTSKPAPAPVNRPAPPVPPKPEAKPAPEPPAKAAPPPPAAKPVTPPPAKTDKQKQDEKDKKKDEKKPE